MPNCTAFTSAGIQCSFAGFGDRMMCQTHNRIHENGLPERRETQCAHFTRQQRCQRECLPGIGHALCERHERQRVETIERMEAERAGIRAERNTRRTMIRRLLTEFSRDRAAWPWRTMVDELLRRRNVDPVRYPHDVIYTTGLQYSMRFFLVDPLDYDNYFGWIRNGRVGNMPVVENNRAVPPPPPVVPELVRIATDLQNVHTAVVSRQTNENLEYILKIDTNGIGTRIVERIGSLWLARPFSTMQNKITALNDMSKWYSQRFCREEGDRLYKRTLDGVFAIIGRTTDVEVRREMVKRLYEECFESVGTCCDGHISRLCNVFVGFHDAFKPQVSVNEQLQNKIAMIAGLVMSRDEKVERATVVFEELHVPPPERIAWLEALE